jgi:hypothetical protein
MANRTGWLVLLRTFEERKGLDLSKGSAGTGAHHARGERGGRLRRITKSPCDFCSIQGSILASTFGVVVRRLASSVAWHGQTKSARLLLRHPWLVLRNYLQWTCWRMLSEMAEASGDIWRWIGAACVSGAQGGPNGYLTTIMSQCDDCRVSSCRVEIHRVQYIRSWLFC